MRVYSAAEAIGPAWEHTTAMVWQPRRAGTLLKLCLIACIAELAISGFAVRMPAPATVRMGGGGLNHQSVLLIGMLATFFLLLALIFGLALFYVSSRVQLVLFDLVARRSTLVAPSWHYFGRVTWRWIGLKLLLSAALLVVSVPLWLPAALRLLRTVRLRSMDASTGLGATAGGFGSHELFRPLLLVLVPLSIFMLTAVALYWMLRDFALPSLALEDVTAAAALRRVWDLLRFDTGAVLLFLLLRLLLGIAASLIAYLAVGIAALISALPFALIGYLAWLPLHASASGSIVAYGILGILGGVWLLWTFLLLIAGRGTLLIFYQAWSMYFLGSRYPLLGNLLEPPIAVPVWTPPPSLPKDDEDDGPGFPMDPVPA